MGRTGGPARTGFADYITRQILSMSLIKLNAPFQRFTQNKNSYKAGKAKKTSHKIILYWKVILKQELKFSHLFLIQQGASEWRANSCHEWSFPAYYKGVFGYTSRSLNKE